MGSGKRIIVQMSPIRKSKPVRFQSWPIIKQNNAKDYLDSLKMLKIYVVNQKTREAVELKRIKIHIF